MLTTPAYETVAIAEAVFVHTGDYMLGWLWLNLDAVRPVELQLAARHGGTDNTSGPVCRGHRRSVDGE